MVSLALYSWRRGERKGENFTSGEGWQSRRNTAERLAK